MRLINLGWGVWWRVEHRDPDLPSSSFSLLFASTSLSLSSFFTFAFSLLPLRNILWRAQKGRRRACVRAGTIPEKAINLQAIFMIIYTI